MFFALVKISIQITTIHLLSHSHYVYYLKITKTLSHKCKKGFCIRKYKINALRIVVHDVLNEDHIFYVLSFLSHVLENLHVLMVFGILDQLAIVHERYHDGWHLLDP